MDSFINILKSKTSITKAGFTLYPEQLRLVGNGFRIDLIPRECLILYIVFEQTGLASYSLFDNLMPKYTLHYSVKRINQKLSSTDISIHTVRDYGLKLS